MSLESLPNQSMLCSRLPKWAFKNHSLRLWFLKTPRAGFEPATNRLTVDRSTAELPWIEPPEPSSHTLRTASGFKRCICKSPESHGPICPFSILAAPSQNFSSSKRRVIQIAVMGLFSQLHSFLTIFKTVF